MRVAPRDPHLGPDPVVTAETRCFQCHATGYFRVDCPEYECPVVANGLPATHNITVSETTAPSAIVSPTWPITVPLDDALSATLPITFSSTVLLWRTQVPALSSMRETLRGFDVVPVVQAFAGGIVTVQGHGLVLSIVHLLVLTIDSPLTFTVLIFFLTDTFRYVVW